MLNIDIILNDLWNIFQTIIGISCSIMTLLYSFIIGKRNELKVISDSIKNNGGNPNILQNETFIKKYIYRFKKISQKWFIILIGSVLISVVIWIAERINLDFAFKKYLIIGIIVLSITLILYILYTAISLIRLYISDTKI